MPSFAKPRDIVLHYSHTAANPMSRPVVFVNSLGTDLRIWDDIRARLDPAIPVLAVDKRGHGLSQDGMTTIATLARDMADMMDYLGLTDAVICGVSVGGMIAQHLASVRPDLVAGLVLCNTGTQIGDAASWDARIAAVHAGGLDALAPAILDRWFAPAWRAANPVLLAGWRTMLARTSPAGYVATCAAIRDADLTQATARLNVPTLCIAGHSDGATPPALVQKMADLIAGATFTCLNDIGHLPCIEAPDQLAALLTRFYGDLP